MTPTRPSVDEPLRDAYLRRLGFDTPPPATVETLRAIHGAQVERVPYESVWVWLGERRTIEPLDSVRYLVSGRGGYESRAVARDPHHRGRDLGRLARAAQRVGRHGTRVLRGHRVDRTATT